MWRHSASPVDKLHVTLTATLLLLLSLYRRTDESLQKETITINFRQIRPIAQ